jgi:5'-nucleotidase
MLNRRSFITKSFAVTGSLMVGSTLTNAAHLLASPIKLTILHTNDVHSRIDPFPMDGGQYQGLGGVAARSLLINEIRSKEKNVLLLDAGDMFQGTPYFNIYKGEPEIKAMTAMGYDAGTIGNHDFDAGLENLATQVSRHAAFPMLIANYDFTGTPMENKNLPYKIFRKEGLKIGVFGLGIELKGLVAEALYKETKYLDPVQTANEIADRLNKEGCDFIICLSHLGYRYDTNKVSDEVLAKETQNIDLIIGGHTHTFLPKPVIMKNKIGKEMLINQVGYAGIMLGRLDFIFEPMQRKNLIQSIPLTVTEISAQ